MLSTLPARSLRGARKVSYPDTVQYLYSLGNELKPGAKIFIAAAVKQPDGTLQAPRVAVGRGIAPPM